MQGRSLIAGYVRVAVRLLAATLTLASCEAATDRRVVEAPDGGVVEDGAPSDREERWAGVPLLSGWLIEPVAEADPPAAAPVSLAIDAARRRLYVLELQPPELRVYDATNGRYIETLGREGDGPGEYRHPVDLAISAEGTVAVLSMSGRLTFWDTAGVLLKVDHAGAGMATDVVAAAGDTFYVKLDVFPPADVSRFYLVTPDSAIATPFFDDERVAATDERGRRYRNHSYAVGATPKGDLLLSPPGPDYLIMRVGSDGRVLSTMRRPEVPPIRRDEQETAALVERVKKGFAAAGRSAPSSLSIPLYRSHISSLDVAPDGSVWTVTQRGDSTITILDCVTADGEYGATFSVPFAVSSLAVTLDRLFLLARGPLEVPGVAVARRPECRMVVHENQ